jgi:hypothetical protein
MADSNFRGPINSMGALEVNAATTAVEVLDGPSLFYQGAAIPDIRSAPFAKDGFRPGQQAAFGGYEIPLIDAIPQKLASNLLATAQIVTSAITVSLITAQPAGLTSSAGIAVGVPIIPLGTTVATIAALALDFGFTTGTTTTNSSTVVVLDSSVFRLGQWIVIGGAGNSTASRSHIAQVQSLATSPATAITVLPAVVTGILNAPIGQANLWGSSLLPNATQFGPAAASANAHAFGGAVEGGFARIYNPREMSSRNIAVQGVTAIQVAYSAVVSGWDVWGAPMTEIISAATGVTSFIGKKAFKYISSITTGTTVPSSQTVAFGLGDVVGLPLRADYWEELYATWNGVSMANFSGFVAGITGTTVSNGTADVRGTLQLSTSIVTGGLATAMSVIASNGTGRIFVSMMTPPNVEVLSTPINQSPKFGIAQYTATT